MNLSGFHIIMDQNGSMTVSKAMSKLESTAGGVVIRIKLSLTGLSRKMLRLDSLLLSSLDEIFVNSHLPWSCVILFVFSTHISE